MGSGEEAEGTLHFKFAASRLGKRDILLKL